MFLVHKLKIAFYTKCLRTSGSFRSRVKRNDKNRKRRHKTVWEQPYSVNTSKSIFRRLSSFFGAKGLKDYKLIVLGGTEEHEQLIFIRKHSKPNCKVHMYNEAKVFDPNVQEGKPTLPLALLVQKLKITPENKQNLMYDRASHRLSNITNKCAVFVALEIRNAMLDGRDPFTRSKLPFYSPKK